MQIKVKGRRALWVPSDGGAARRLRADAAALI